jgi:hypothetical protein
VKEDAFKLAVSGKCDMTGEAAARLYIVRAVFWRLLADIEADGAGERVKPFPLLTPDEIYEIGEASRARLGLQPDLDGHGFQDWLSREREEVEAADDSGGAGASGGKVSS